MFQLMSLTAAWIVGWMARFLRAKLRNQPTPSIGGLGNLIGVLGSALGVTAQHFLLNASSTSVSNAPIAAIAGTLALVFSLDALVWAWKNTGEAMAIVVRFAKIYGIGVMVGILTTLLCWNFGLPLIVAVLSTFIFSQLHWLVQSKAEFVNAWRKPKQIVTAFQASVNYIRFGTAMPSALPAQPPVQTRNPTSQPPARTVRRPRGGPRP